jgi:hypothetical protein
MRRWWVPVGLILVTGWLAYDIVRALNDHLLSLAVIGVLTVPFVYLLNVVEQSGFLLAGLVMGFEPRQLNLGQLVATRTSTGWQLRNDWRWWLFAGERTSFALTPEHLRWRHGIMRTGAPAGLVAVGAALVVAKFSFQDGTILLLLVPTGFLVLWSLIPRKVNKSGRWSEGLWLWRWIFQPKVAARTIAIEALSAASGSGLRPRDWDERWVVLAAAGPRWPESHAHVVGLQFGYAAALDAGDVNRASALMDGVLAGLELLPENLRRLNRIEPAFFAARFRGDVALADVLLTQAAEPDSPISAGDLQRARAAAHYAAGRLAVGGRRDRL